jgi:hypothetical protein
MDAVGSLRDAEVHTYMQGVESGAMTHRDGLRVIDTWRPDDDREGLTNAGNLNRLRGMPLPLSVTHCTE